MTTVLHWFRNDLRVHDNPGLTRAVQEAQAGLRAGVQGNLLCVFCHDPDQEQVLPWGATRMGPFRLAFLRETLDALRAELKERGSFLVELHGPQATTVIECAATYGATKVTYQAEVAPEERGVEMDLRTLACARGIEALPCGFSTLLGFDGLKTSPERMPDVFTLFRTEVERHESVPAPRETPKTLPPPPSGVELLSEVARKTKGESDPRHSFFFTGGEAAGLARVEHYFWKTNAVATYFETRNGMLQESDATRFSAWLANGSLSARAVYRELKRYERERTSNKSTYWVYFELLWRDFFKAMALKHGTRLFCEAGLRSASLPQDLIARRSLGPEEERRRFAAWREGTTGAPLVDACMRELATTGFMSNRGRQIVASFLVHTLCVRWTWGAWHFESLLVDYDPASNWGNWAYQSGVGNDPRGTRVFNVTRQAETYDPRGEFVGRWLGTRKIL